MRLLYQDLARSSPAAGPFVTILWDSLWDPGMKILVKVFYTSLWQDLVEILVESARYLCMVSYRLLWEDLVEILLKSFSRGPCVKILKIFEDALRWCWSESSSWMLLGSSLSRSSEILCIEGPSLTIFCTSPRCPGMRFWRPWWVDIALILVPTQVLLLQTRWCLAWSVTVP